MSPAALYPLAVAVFTVPKIGLHTGVNKWAADVESGSGAGASVYNETITLPPPPTPQLIPRRLIMGSPERTSAQLSPDGRFMAWKAPVAGVLNVWIADFRDVKNEEQAQAAITAAKAVTFDTGRGILGYTWTFLADTLIYIQDEDGDENYKLFKLDVAQVDKPEVDVLYGKKGVRVQFMDMSEDRPEILIYSTNDRDPRYFDVYWVDMETNETGLIYENTGGFDSFTLDNNMTIRLASLPQDDGSDLLMEAVRNETDGCIESWRPYRLIEVDDTYNTGISGFDKDNKHVYWADSAGRDKAALYKRPFHQPNHTDDEFPILVPEKSDLGGIALHPRTREPLLAVENYDVPKLFLLDPQFRQDFVNFYDWDEYAYPSVAGYSQDMRRWLLVLRKTNAPTQYILYDRETQTRMHLFYTQPELLPYEMATREPLVIQTRDGLDMLCYLSMPIDRPIGVPGPLVLDVHGGPRSRDGWGFSSTAQLLTNRGIAVLECNYRASTGFGKAYVKAGNGQWSRKMHDDLIDAVDWAVNKSIADPDRVAIMGGSYGGYAALVGLTSTPDVFACGVDIVGPANIATLAASVPEYWKPYRAQLELMFGCDLNDTECMHEISPLFRVGNITKPLLIAQGAQDPRVNVAEAEQMVSALRTAGIAYTYVLFSDEGHGFVRPENRLAFSAVNERFLHECLGTDRVPEPMAADTVRGTTAVVERLTKWSAQNLAGFMQADIAVAA